MGEQQMIGLLEGIKGMWSLPTVSQIPSGNPPTSPWDTSLLPPTSPSTPTTAYLIHTHCYCGQLSVCTPDSDGSEFWQVATELV